MDRQRVVVAEILRPRGIKGELLVHSQSDVPGRLEQLRNAHARLTDGADAPVEIEKTWPYKEHWVIKLAGVDSIDAAERFRGAELWVAPGERGKLPDGEFFQTDLIGCDLIDAATGERVGLVDGWQHYGGAPLMEVKVTDGREALVPFTASICREVNLELRMIRVDLPAGLLDL